MKLPVPKIPDLSGVTNSLSGISDTIRTTVDTGGIIISAALDAVPTVDEVKDQVGVVVSSARNNVIELIGIIQNPHPTLDGKLFQAGSLAWNIVITGQKVTAILIAPQVRFVHNLTGGFSTDIRIAQVTLKVGDALIRPEENFIPRVMQVGDAVMSTVDLFEYLELLGPIQGPKKP